MLPGQQGAPIKRRRSTRKIEDDAFYSMMPHLLYEMFEALHRAFREPSGKRPATRMADFEEFGRAMAGPAGQEFAESLRGALPEAAP